MQELIQSFRSRKQKELQARIRQARLKIGTGVDIASWLGVDQATISRFETGKRLPSADFLSRLARITGVSYVEELHWLGLAGYLPWTRMPSARQTIEGLELYCRDIAKDYYPSIIIDYRFTMWAMNPAAYSTFGYTAASELLTECLTMLHIVYSDKLGLIDRVLNQREHTQRSQLVMFKAFNLNRRHEPFYERFPELMKNEIGVGTRGSREFQHHWNATEVTDDIDTPRISEGGIEIVSDPFHIQQSLLFRQRLERTFHLPQFAFLRWEPHSKGAVEAFLHSDRIENRGVLKLWDLIDVNPLIERYDRENLMSQPTFTR